MSTYSTLPLDDLYLDPLNPRLGRVAHRQRLTQDQILKKMFKWSLEELAVSFLANGFWPQEAVVCVKEKHRGKIRYVVVEGNRRVAALLRLRDAFEGEESSKRWIKMIGGRRKPPKDLFEKIPVHLAPSRSEVDSYLGFRHVTGIKQWAPAEKAQFIAKLIEEKGMTYEEVMRRIGSQTPVVTRAYVSYCLLLQMERLENVPTDEVEGRFSILSEALRHSEIREFIGVTKKFECKPSDVYPPVGPRRVKQLTELSRWLFGDERKNVEPVLTDSRHMSQLAASIESKDSLEYLRSASKPSLDHAFSISGGEKEKIYNLLLDSSGNVQSVLSILHHYKKDKKLIRLAKSLSDDIDQVKSVLGLE